MPKSQLAGDFRAPDAAVFPKVHVAAADAGGRDVDQALSCGGRRGGDFCDGEGVGRVGCDCDVGEGEGGHGDGGGLRDLMVVVMGFCGGILGELIRGWFVR